MTALLAMSASQSEPETKNGRMRTRHSRRRRRCLQLGLCTPTWTPVIVVSYYFQAQISAINSHLNLSRIRIIGTNGVSIAIDDAAATDTILEIKQRVFAACRKLYVRRQRLVYRAGPFGMDELQDEETLSDAGVAQDDSAELDLKLWDEQV
jgi:hypothetical protein